MLPSAIRRARVAVELTARCPLRCGMCPIDRLTRPVGDMSMERMERIAAELSRLGLTVDWLHEMGEPLVHPRFDDAIRLFPGCGVSTSGLPLDEARGGRLLDARPARVRIGLDTLDRAAYARIRTGSDFDRVVTNIRRFLEMSRGGDVTVEIERLRTKLTREESSAMFREFFGLSRYPQAVVVDKVATGLDRATATDIHHASAGCAVGGPLEWVVVLWDGRVTHCCFDWDGLQSLGNLDDDPLDVILERGKLQELAGRFSRREFAQLPRCAECHAGCEAESILPSRLNAAVGALARLPAVRAAARRLLPESFRRDVEERLARGGEG